MRRQLVCILNMCRFTYVDKRIDDPLRFLMKRFKYSKGLCVVFTKIAKRYKAF